jgi:hypothetical protein
MGTIAIKYDFWHHRWRIRKPAVQSKPGERSLKARRACFVHMERIPGMKK